MNSTRSAQRVWRIPGNLPDDRVPEGRAARTVRTLDGMVVRCDVDEVLDL